MLNHHIQGIIPQNTIHLEDRFRSTTYKPALQLADVSKMKQLLEAESSSNDSDMSMQQSDSESSSEEEMEVEEKEKKRRRMRKWKERGGQGKLEESVKEWERGDLEEKEEEMRRADDEEEEEEEEEEGNDEEEVGDEDEEVVDQEEEEYDLSDMESIDGRPVKRPRILQESEDDDWTRDELKNLLLGIKNHGSNWYKVAKEVGTKTPEECILRFLQLPIEDKFLTNNEYGESEDIGPLKYAPHLPFSRSENPVLSTIAFLVGLVDPDVVRAMTQRALSFMYESSQEQEEEEEEEEEAEEEEEGGEEKEKEKEKEKEEEEKEATINEVTEEVTQTENGMKDVTSDAVPDDDKENATTDAEKLSNDPMEVSDEEDEVEKEEEEEEEEEDDDEISEQFAEATTVQEGSEIALATVGVRARVFATNEERQMYKLTNQLYQVQLEKLDSKLKIFDALQRSIEFEKKQLERQQEENLLQRISFAKSANKVVERLEQTISKLHGLESNKATETDQDSLTESLAEVKQLLRQPLSLSIGPKRDSSTSTSGEGTVGVEGARTVGEETDVDNVKPVSIEAPQVYRYWSA